MTSIDGNKQDELNSCIRFLAEKIRDNDEIQKVISRLEAIYTQEFRHYYSKIFPLILEFYKNDENKYSLDYLFDNVITLNELTLENVKGNDEFTQAIEKLCDHLYLEIAQVNAFLMKPEGDIAKESEKYQYEYYNTNLINATANIDKATEELTNAKKKTAALQSEFITILGIFSAIIISFSGGISFLGNALSSVGQAPLSYTILIALICGFVLFNIVFLLFYMIGKLSGRNIYARCKTDDCSCEEICNGWNRIKNRLPYVFYINAGILISITFLVIFLFLEKMDFRPIINWILH